MANVMFYVSVSLFGFIVGLVGGFLWMRFQKGKDKKYAEKIIRESNLNVEGKQGLGAFEVEKVAEELKKIVSADYEPLEEIEEPEQEIVGESYHQPQEVAPEPLRIPVTPTLPCLICQKHSLGEVCSKRCQDEWVRRNAFELNQTYISEGKEQPKKVGVLKGKKESSDTLTSTSKSPGKKTKEVKK